MPTRRFCFVLLVTAVLAVACSSAAATPNYLAAPYDRSAATEAPAGLPAASAAGPGAFPAAPTSASAGEQGAANPTMAAPAASFIPVVPEDQIVKTGTIAIKVTAIDSSVAQATGQIHSLGGWLAGSDRTTSNAEDTASVTYRIPVSRFEDALALMRTLGTKVLSEHTESTPVGGQIVDLQARIANLKASETAIQAIMNKAATITEVLTVQQRLEEVQGQIEELSGQLSGLTDQAAYSTLTVVFMVPVLPTPTPSATASPSPTATPLPWSAGDQAGQAAGTLGEVGKGAATVLIWAAILVLPVSVAFTVLLALLGLLVRLLEPYRRRLLPFTVPQPVAFARPYVPGPIAPAPTAAAGPEDQPKA